MINTKIQRSQRGKQSGFTIIELVVVILLLGILTATALPRFLDVTDEAHAAVVDGVRAGLLTGGALFRAQWVGEGQRTTTAITQYNGLWPNAAGYPVGTIDATLGDDANDCEDIYISLLQAGRPSIDSPATTDAAITGAEVTTAAASGVDILAKYTGSNECTYAYIAQFQSLAGDNIPNLVMTLSTGGTFEAGNVREATAL